jgi:hypothetical protein
MPRGLVTWRHVPRNVGRVSIWTSLEPASTTVNAGGTAIVRLRLRNTGDVVDEYRFVPVGNLAPYTTVEPPTLRLYPGTTGSVQLTFAPPRTPDATAGPNPYGVQIVPTEHPEATTVPEGNVTITPFTEVRAELVPQTVKGRFRGRPKLAVDNLGNTKLTASLGGSDNGDELSYEIHPSNVQIEPGRAAFINVRLRPRQIIWFGHKQRRPYSLAVRRSGHTPVTVDGIYIQRGVLPRWLATVFSIGLALTMTFIVLWLRYPQFGTKAIPEQITQASSSLPPAEAPALQPPAATVPTPQGGGSGGGSQNTAQPPQQPGGSGGGGNGGGGVPAPPAQPPARPPAQPPAQPSGGEEIVGQGSGRCITVTDGVAPGGKDGKRLELWDCNKVPWEEWTFVSDGTSDGRGTFQSLGLCMDVAGASTADGTPIQLANCSGNPAQVWTLSPQGDLVSILAKTKCADATNAGTDNGTQLQLWPCNGTPAQKWTTRTPS